MDHAMKQFVVVVFAASVLLLAGCCTTPSVAKWEYKVAAPLRQAFGGANNEGPQDWRERQQAFLNDLGKEGWVLVSQTDGQVFYFKRLVK